MSKKLYDERYIVERGRVEKVLLNGKKKSYPTLQNYISFFGIGE